MSAPQVYHQPVEGYLFLSAPPGGPGGLIYPPMTSPPPPAGPAGPPGPPSPGPPYGGPPVRYEPGSPGTPRRRGRIGRILAVVLSLAVVGGMVGGVVYYEQSYKPRHYLREWSFRMAAPQ